MLGRAHRTVRFLNLIQPKTMKGIMTKFVPYDHQKRALDDTYQSMRKVGSRPVCCVPTGGGKTVIAGWLAKGVLHENPNARVAVLAHVGELVKQNHETIQDIIGQPVGIYNAGLKRKDVEQQVICGSIQSIWKRTNIGTERSPAVGKFDAIIIDEAHRIPDKTDSQYQNFLRDQGYIEGTEEGPKIIGLSATPYRLGTGKIYGLGKMFTELSHNMSVLELIEKGILCAPISMRGDKKTNFSKVKTKRGEFDENDVAKAMHPNLPHIVQEIVHKAGKRKKWIIFAVNIAQAENIKELLNKLNVSAEAIHSNLSNETRKQILNDYHADKFTALVNVSVLTEGFDNKKIDLVALVRPTKSTGLYVQMVGRGLRYHKDKQDVLILDFGQNVSRHGPIDIPLVKAESQEGKGKKGAPTKVCPPDQTDANGREGCGFDEIPISAKKCPECGFEFPKPMSKLETKASLLGVLSKPMWFEVKRVRYEQYRKVNSGNVTLRCDYTIFDPDDPSTTQVVTEWMPFNSANPHARKRCADWWTMRGGEFPIPDNPQRAMDRIKNRELKHKPVMVQIRRKKDSKFIEVSKYKFKHQLETELA